MFVPLIFQKYKIGYETCLLSLKWTNIYGGSWVFFMIKITLSFRRIGVFHMIRKTLYFDKKLNAARLLRRLMLFCYVMWSNCVGSLGSSRCWICCCSQRMYWLLSSYVPSLDWGSSLHFHFYEGYNWVQVVLRWCLWKVQSCCFLFLVTILFFFVRRP